MPEQKTTTQRANQPKAIQSPRSMRIMVGLPDERLGEVGLAALTPTRQPHTLLSFGQRHAVNQAIVVLSTPSLPGWPGAGGSPAGPD